MFILKKGHQPGVYVPLRALLLVHSRNNNDNSQLLFDSLGIVIMVNCMLFTLGIKIMVNCYSIL